MDKLTWLFGALLTITGIVLFILNALNVANLHIAAIATTSVGSGIFLLGVCSNCCREWTSEQAGVADGIQALQTPTQVKTKPLTPLAQEIKTKDFFESKGIFGVPQQLINEIDIWRKCRATEKFNIALDAGFILDGPPGNGKTTIAHAIAEILGGEYIEQKCGDVLSQWQGGAQKNITKLFTVPKNQFRVVVLDEISGLLPSRRGIARIDPSVTSITNHFLGIVEGALQQKPSYIIIGTTNDVNFLDEALKRRGRLGKTFVIQPPNSEARAKIFSYQLSRIPHSTDEDWNQMIVTGVQRTAGLSCAAILGIISDAQKKALLQGRDLRIVDFYAEST